MSSFQSFADLPLSIPIQKAIADLGFTQLTPTQAKILPHTLANQDVIGQAQTGTGKTATFLITLIEFLLKHPFLKKEKRFLGEARAVILAPTRELAQQIFQDCQNLTRYTNLYSVCLLGGSDYDQQKTELTQNYLDILIATPGRLIDWIQKGIVFLDRTEILVLDEADRMLDMGFIPDIKRLIQKMPPNTHRQSLLFSATFNQDVMNLAYRWLYHPTFIEIEPQQKTNLSVKQNFYLLSEQDKWPALLTILEHQDWDKIIIFANRKTWVKKLYDKLSQHYPVAMLSGDVHQQKREQFLHDFKTGKIKIMVATDVAGRGIHVDDISHVINYTLPDQPDDYVHRIGRTGRAGQSGVSISLISEEDGYNLMDLEKHLATKFDLQSWHKDAFINLDSDNHLDSRSDSHLDGKVNDNISPDYPNSNQDNL